MSENLCKLEPLVQSYTKLQWQIVEQLFLRIDTLSSEELHILNTAKNNLEFLMLGGEIPVSDTNKFIDELSFLEEKHNLHLKLTKHELELVYGLKPVTDVKSYDKRFMRIRKERNKDSDMILVFDCSKDQIAHSPIEITPKTKVYIGPLEANLFKRLLPDIEYIFTPISEGRVKQIHTEIGGKTVGELVENFEEKNYVQSNEANFMIMSQKFKKSIYQDKKMTKLKPEEFINLIQLSVADLGFSRGATTSQILERVKELGLELCPPEVGPYLRLQYDNQPTDEWILVGMEGIPGPHGDLQLFRVDCDRDGMWLGTGSALPDNMWGSQNQWVFRCPET